MIKTKIINLRIVLSGKTYDNATVDFVWFKFYDEDSGISRRMINRELKCQLLEEITNQHCYEITNINIQIDSIEPTIIDCKDLEVIKI